MVATALAALARSAWAGGDAVVVDAVVLRPMVEAEVPARLAGVLARIVVAEGAAVEAGDLLAALDDRAARLAVDQARWELAHAEAQLANELSIQYAIKALAVARAELARSERSNQQFPNSISQSQLDVERLTVEKLQLEQAQAEHERQLLQFEVELKRTALAAAELDLDLHQVRAPFAGVASLIRARVGEWVEPAVPMVRLVAVDRLRAEGFAPAAAVTAALAGGAVDFTLEGPDQQPLPGRLAFVSPEVDPVTRQVRVWAEIDNARGRLRPGQQGRLSIPLGDAARPGDDRP